MFDSDKQKKANKKTYKISTDANSFLSLYVETGWESSSYGSSTVVWMAHRPAKEFHVRMEAKKKISWCLQIGIHTYVPRMGEPERVMCADSASRKRRRVVAGSGEITWQQQLENQPFPISSWRSLSLSFSLFLPLSFCVPSQQFISPSVPPVEQLPLCATGFYIFCCYFITRQNGR